MNLYLFNDNDSAARFGIGTYLNELTHALVGADIHVHIVHLHADRPEFDIIKVGHVEHWHIPEARNRNTFDGDVQKMEDYFRNVVYLLRLYIRDTNDLVFHFNYNLCYMLAKKLKESFACKTVTTIHFMKWALEMQGNLSRFHTLKSKPESQRSSFEQLLYTTDEYEGLLYSGVDSVIALSQYTKRLLLDEYHLMPDSVSVIPNGLADARTEKEANRAVLRRKWNISDNEWLVLFVGRLHVVKGLTYLIQAFRKVTETIPDCRLVIAGRGNDEMYRREIQDMSAKITLTGLLGKNELYELYRIADIGVMPSFHEQCSYVAIEMMMHGVPLIASTSTGLREMVEDGITGLHIPVVEHSDKV